MTTKADERIERTAMVGVGKRSSPLPISKLSEQNDYEGQGPRVDLTREQRV
jgi:hypothetical protein